MAQIDDAPSDKWLPAGQKLIFTIIPDAPITSATRYIVQVEENNVEICKVYLTPNTNESAFFDLSEVVTGRVEVDAFKYGLNSTIHSLNNNVYTKSNNGVKKYVVKVGEWDGSSEELAQDVSSNYYLLDGYEQLSAGLDPGYNDYYGTGINEKFWLTDRVPSSNIIHVTAGIEDTGVFAFINTDDTSSAVEQIIAVIYDNDGIEDASINYTIAAATGGQSPAAAAATYWYGTLLYAYLYPASYISFTNALNAVVGGWSYYDLIPATAAGVQSGNRIRVTNNCRYSKNEAVQLAWANTRGGWDYLRFNGKKQKTVTREEKTYRKIVGDYGATSFSFAPTAREIKPYQLEAKEQYQLNGLLTIEELTLMQYCMRSKNVMAKIGGTWLPVTIQTNSMQIEEETVSKVFVTSFNVELAQIIRC
jgi:hypothetical protein